MNASALVDSVFVDYGEVFRIIEGIIDSAVRMRIGNLKANWSHLLN